MSETEPAVTITFQLFAKAKQNPSRNGFFCRSYWCFCHMVAVAAAIP